MHVLVAVKPKFSFLPNLHAGRERERERKEARKETRGPKGNELAERYRIIPPQTRLQTASGKWSENHGFRTSRFRGRHTKYQHATTNSLSYSHPPTASAALRRPVRSCCAMGTLCKVGLLVFPMRRCADMAPPVAPSWAELPLRPPTSFWNSRCDGDPRRGYSAVAALAAVRSCVARGRAPLLCVL